MKTPQPRPPRRDATLKNLPEERQAEIVAYMDLKGWRETKSWLAADGVSTSLGALSDFRSWWQLQQQYKQSASDVETLLDQMRQEQPELSEEKLFAYGQQVFGVLALKAADTKDWARIQTLRLEADRIAGLQRKVKVAEEALKLAEEKFQFDASALCLKHLPTLRTIAAKSGVSQQEKIRQVRLALFGEAPQ